MSFTSQHLLGIEPLRPEAITEILDLANAYVEQNRKAERPDPTLAGLTQINMFLKTPPARRPVLNWLGNGWARL